MCMVSSSSRSKGHSETVALRWEEDRGGGLVRSWGSNGGNLRGPGEDAVCSRLLSDLAILLLSAPTTYTPRQGPSGTHVPFCGSMLDFTLMQAKASVSSPALAVIYSLCGLFHPRSSHPAPLAQVQLGRPQGGLGPRADSPRPSSDLPLGGAAPSQSPRVYAGGWHGCSRNEWYPVPPLKTGLEKVRDFKEIVLS